MVTNHGEAYYITSGVEEVFNHVGMRADVTGLFNLHTPLALTRARQEAMDYNPVRLFALDLTRNDRNTSGPGV